MSRIGQHPVPVPSGVQVTLGDGSLAVTGSLGTLSMSILDDVIVTHADDAITVAARGDTKRSRSMWGLHRSLVANMVTGVTEGFTKDLEIVGVGYRASVQGGDLVLQLGYSRDRVYPIPEGMEIACARPTMIKISGIDKQHVGQVAAEIRRFRPPEPYKGKGIRYAGEHVFRKEGKKK